MRDPHQTKAVRVQSSAIVLAALITTSGAVVAACIQTGWISRPSATSIAAALPEPVTKQAFFTGTIEPVDTPPLSPPVTNTFAAGGARAASFNRDVAVDPLSSLGRPTPIYSDPAPPQGHAQSVKPAPKLLDWGTIPRRLQGHN